MKTRHTILTLAVGATLAVGVPTAQATLDHSDRALPASRASASSHSTAAQKAMRLRAQYLANFRKVHGAGGVAPGGVYTPGNSTPSTPGAGGVATGDRVDAPGNSAAAVNLGSACGYGDWC